MTSGQTARVSSDLTTGFPPHCAPVDEASQPNSAPHHTDQAQDPLRLEWQALVLCQPGELFKQESHNLLWQLRVISPSCNYRPHLLWPLLVHSVPECHPHVALCGEQCAPLGCEYTWLMNVVDLSPLEGAGVSCVQLCPQLWSTNLSLTDGVKKMCQNTAFLFLIFLRYISSL